MGSDYSFCISSEQKCLKRLGHCFSMICLKYWKDSGQCWGFFSTHSPYWQRLGNSKNSASVTEILGSITILFSMSFWGWMALSGLWLDLFVSWWICVNVLSSFNIWIWCSLVHEQKRLWLMGFMDWVNYFVCNPKNSRLELFDVVYDGNCWLQVLKHVARALLLCRFNGGSLQCFSSSVISSEDQVCYYWMFVVLHWLFSPTWDNIQLRVTLKVGFICPCMVIDPTGQ